MQVNDAVNTRMKRRLERRELQVYYAVGFALFLPVVAMGRLGGLLKGRSSTHRESILAETSAKVGAMLGFVFMA